MSFVFESIKEGLLEAIAYANASKKSDYNKLAFSSIKLPKDFKL